MTEPARLISLLNAAITATLGVVILVGLDPQIGGALGVALAAWVAFAGELIRSKVTPLAAPKLTPSQYDLLEIQGDTQKLAIGRIGRAVPDHTEG